MVNIIKKYVRNVIGLIIEIGLYVPLFIGETIVANIMRRDVSTKPCLVSHIIGSLFSLITVPMALIISPFIGLIATIRS